MKKNVRIYTGVIFVLATILFAIPIAELISPAFFEAAETVKPTPTIISPAPEPTQPIIEEKPLPTELYIEIVNGCGAHWSGICAAVWSTPATSTTATPTTYLRNGVTLKVDEKVTDAAGNIWYKIIFDEWLRYPERVYSDWYIEAKYAKEFQDAGMLELTPAQITKLPEPHKKILVDKSDQKLYAYDGEHLFMETVVSTGTFVNPTPVGEFNLFRKMPSRYMQGPLPGIPEDIYDLPGVPWTLYFTKDGAAIHGAYWHNNFGQRMSHGCVNMPLAQARELYTWADLGTAVTVQE